MVFHGSGPYRSVSVALLVVAVAACGSAAGSAAPPSSGLQASSAASADHSATATQTVAPGISTAAPTSGRSGGAGECPAGLTSGHQKFALEGYEAWRFCGPAPATVTLGGSTVQISGGSCTTPSAGTYSVAIGTELFGDPPASLEPDYLNIYIVSTDGLTDPGGVVDHTGWLLVGTTVTFGPGKQSGTFSGTTINPGTVVSGSFTCQ